MRLFNRWHRGLLWWYIGCTLLIGGCGEQPEQIAARDNADGGREARRPIVVHKVEASKPRRDTSRPVPLVQRDDELLSGTEPLVMVKGKVTLPSGKPASGAIVSLVSAQLNNRTIKEVARTEADKDGRFRLVGNDRVFYWVKAVRADMAPKMETMQPGGGSNTTALTPSGHRVVTVNFELASGVKVTGRIIDEKDEPVAGARVAIAAKAVRDVGLSAIVETNSDSAGAFAIENAVAGDSFVCASADGFQAIVERVKAPAEKLSLRLVRGGAAFTGTVFEKPGDTPREAVSVTFSRMDALRDWPMGLLPQLKSITDAAGAFQLENLANGKYRIDARTDSLRMVPSNKARSNHVTAKNNDTSTDPLRLFVYAGHTIFGHVREKGSTRPLEGVKVAAEVGSDDTTSTVTGADGKYMLRRIFADQGTNATINAAMQGYSPAAAALVLVGENFEIDKDLELEHSVKVSGMVKLTDGSGAATAFVSAVTFEAYNVVEVSGKAVPTEATGLYEQEVPANSRILVRATAPGYPFALSAPVQVRDEPVTNVDVTLQRGGAIRGTVVDGEGNAIEGADIRATANFYVDATPHFGQMLTAISGADGNFDLRDVPLHDVSLNASKAGFVASDMMYFKLAAGETTSGLVLQLKPACEMSGRVLSKTGEPVAGASVGFSVSMGPGGMGSGEAQRNANVTTDEEGRYQAADVPAGNVDVYIYSNGESYNFGDVESCRTDADFKIDAKPRVTFTGKVIDWQTKAPVTDFAVDTDQDITILRDPANPGEFTVKDLPPKMCYQFRITARTYRELQTEMICMPENVQKLEQVFEMGPGAAVKGRVVRRGDKAPLEGVYVTAVPLIAPQGAQQAKPALTGADGSFVLQDLTPNEKQQLLFSPPSPLLKTERTLATKHGVVTDAGDIEIGAGTVLNGKVVRMPGETAVAGIAVALKDGADSRPPVNTAQHGSFRFVGLKPGKMELRVGGNAETGGGLYMVTIANVEEQAVTIRIGSTKMKGRVTKGGNPAQAQVMAVNMGSMAMRGAATNADGEYEISDLLPGPQMAGVGVNGRSGEPLMVPVIIPERGVLEKDFVLPATTLTGTVVDGEARPVADAQLSLMKKNFFGIDELDKKKIANTGQNGSFTFDELAAGNYSLSAGKDGVGRATVAAVKVPEAGTVSLPPMKLSGSGGALVSIALDYATGKPVNHAGVTLTAADGTVIAKQGGQRDAHGALTVEKVPPGTYRVKVSAGGYTDALRQVEINNDQTERIEDVLMKGVEVIVSVSDKSGSAVAGADVTLTPEDPTSIEQPRLAKTSELGICEVGTMTPGKYRLSATSGSKKASKSVEIAGEGDELLSVVVE